MDFATTTIAGLITFTTTLIRDERGFFCRTSDAAVLRSAGVDANAFVQDSLSRSRKGVIRGMHVRLGRGEAKLVRCSSGRIFDVVVDLRPGSATYGTALTFILDGDDQSSLYVPPGCAHGFQALSDVADTSYRIDRPHDPSEALAIAYDDPELGIPWPLPASGMSEVDRSAERLARLGERLREITALA